MNEWKGRDGMDWTYMSEWSDSLFYRPIVETDRQ